MDTGSYYSESINGFTKNPMLAIPSLIGHFIIYVVTYGALFLGIFGLYGSNIFNYNQTSTSALNTPDLGTSLIFIGIMIMVIIIAWIISGIINAATLGMSKKIVLGEKPDLDVALKYGKKYLLKILAVSLIFGILIVISMIPLILGIILIATDSNTTLNLIGFIIGGLITLILFIGVYLFFIFTYQSVVINKKSIIESFKESFKLVKKNFFEVIVVLIINAIIIAAISFVVGLGTGLLGIFPIIGFILGIIINIIVQALVTPYFALILTYLYMDLKDMIPEEAEYSY